MFKLHTETRNYHKAMNKPKLSLEHSAYAVSINSVKHDKPFNLYGRSDKSRNMY